MRHSLASALGGVEQTMSDEPASLALAGITHLSATSLTTFAKCPDQWRRKYLKREKQRSGVALIWGSADHTAIAHGLQHKIDHHGDECNVSDVLDVFGDTLDQLAASEDVDWKDATLGDVKDQGAALVRAYHTGITPTLDPVAVEHRFTLDVPNVDVPIIGFIDIVTSSRIVERKTTQRRESKPKPDWRTQGLIYSAALDLPVEWHISVRAARPFVSTPLVDPGLALDMSTGASRRIVSSLARRTALQIAWMIDTFGPDEAWPGALTHPFACSYCGFRPTCPWWGR